MSVICTRFSQVFRKEHLCHSRIFYSEPVHYIQTGMHDFILYDVENDLSISNAIHFGQYVKCIASELEDCSMKENNPSQGIESIIMYW